MKIMLNMTNRCRRAGCPRDGGIVCGLLAGQAVGANHRGGGVLLAAGRQDGDPHEFDGTPPQPTGYTIERPARIVLDMPGVTSELGEKHHDLGIGNARRVSIVSTKDRTRAIVNLTRLVPYETSVEGNTLYLLVGAGGATGIPTQTEFTSTDDRGRSPVPFGVTRR
jgi:hypothetical protein